MEISELYSIYLKHPVISTDSRVASKGSLFFALSGNNFDGNRFAEEAIANGASYAIVDNPDVVTSNRFILVHNSLKVLQALANFHRNKFKIPFIAITGTNGKTTTKELVANVLSEQYNVLYTQGNLNNHIGVPLTLLRLTKQHEIAVIEMGANHREEIKELCNIVEPDYGIITNIGIAHMEGFGSEMNLINTKKELYDYIKENKPNGKIFINGNDALLTNLAKGLNLSTIEYGTGENNEYFITGKVLENAPMLRLQWCLGSICYETETSLVGDYNLTNVLAAITIAKYFGVCYTKINKALKEYQAINNRSQFKQTEKNKLIIDAYNANPTSMKAALENFNKISAENKILILGSMLELGEHSRLAHQNILDLIESYDLKDVYLVGNDFKELASNTKFHCFDNSEELKQYIKSHPITDSYILLKGSRGVKLEEISELL